MKKIYYPKYHYNPNYRGQTFPLLKPFIKSEGFTDAERQAGYGISEADVVFVETLAQADLALLPMAWNYYMQTKQTAKALQFLKQTQALGVHTWVVMLDDVGLNFPDFSHVMVFRQSGYRSKLPVWHVGLPVFIGDPLQKHYNRQFILERAYRPEPVVGFCGFASPNISLALKTMTKTTLKNLGYYLKVLPQQPELIMAAAKWRFSILKRLEGQAGIVCNFIYRAQYRAGSQTNKERAVATREFFDNMNASDYVVCMRGAGNFSVRLYETLAMGRIPIYIHTDGLLPLAESISWREHVVWIDAEELDAIGERVLAFHQALTAESFKNLQKRNRKLWEEKLRLKGFFEQTS